MPLSRAAFAFICLMFAYSSATASPDAEALAEKMLSALGGRAVWAAATSTTNDSQQNRTDDPTVVRAVIWLDFKARRFRIETRGPEFHSIRVVDGDAGWRKRNNGTIEDIPADIWAEDMDWYGAHVYRSIHRMAARDPAFSYRLGTDGRLEIVESGKRLIWFKLDAKGEPFAFGQRDNDTGSVCGPWDIESGGIKHPLWVSSSDGTWRANIKALKINTPFDPQAFARPKS